MKLSKLEKEKIVKEYEKVKKIMIERHCKLHNKVEFDVHWLVRYSTITNEETKQLQLFFDDDLVDGEYLNIQFYWDKLND